jgi:hypothetical protein
MKTNRLKPVLALMLMLGVGFACNYSTANLSSLKVGKDQGVSQQTSNFDAGDTIYAVATVSNAPGKVKVKGRLVVEDVPGQKAGPIPGLERTLDLDGSGTATFTFSPPTAGWPRGKYKLEVLMMNDKGEQKDEKSASISVS